MKELGVMILGTGWVSGEHIRAFEMNPHSRVTAIVARDVEKAKAKAAEYNLRDVACYSDYDEALQDKNVDIVTICTPNAVHASQTIKAADAGKHILIEKPLAMTWEDTKAMKAAIDKAGVKTLVGYVLHWNPMFVTMKRLLKEGRLGRLFYVEADYFHRVDEKYPCYGWTRTIEGGKSSLLAGGCHAVDALRQFMPGEIDEVTAYTSGLVRDDFEYPGTLAMLVKFKDGTMGKVGSSYDMILPYIFNVHLFGNKGSMINNTLYAPEFIEGQNKYMEIPVTTPDSGDVSHHNFPEEIDHLVDNIIDGTPCECDFNHAYVTQQVVFAGDLSAETGQPVKLPLV